MRSRDQVLKSLEKVYREAFTAAEERGAKEEMARLDFEYQRDQLHLEVMLDLRDALASPEGQGEEEDAGLVKKGSAILEKARSIRNITRLR